MRYGISTKLLLAMLVAVILPLGASAVLLAMVTDWLLEVSVEHRVHDGLERAPEAFRALFEAFKRDFEHSTDGIISSAEFCAALEEGDARAIGEHLEQTLAGREDLIELRLDDEEGEAIAGARAEPPDLEAHFREWSEERELSWRGAPATVTARWIAPRHYFESFQDAGQTLRELEAFQQGRLQVRDLIIEIYLGMVGVVLLVALVLGFLMTRRVTTRVARLREATRQVAGGDLTLRVPVGPLDEVGELTAAFNVMVARLLESRERIEYLQRVAAWQQLARRLAHEIKNPLTPIQLAVEELRDRYKGDDEKYARVLDQATEIVIEEVEALRRLTGEFSAFAKLPEVDAQPVDLRDFLEEASQALSLLRSEQGAVEVALPERGLTVSLDRMLMKRVVNNLVRNALEAIDGAGQPGLVVISGGRGEGGRPFIAVEDDGPGVAADDLRRVFEPYYTTKQTGTGLGLAIVKKIVLEHGGLVTLEPGKERGARFVIHLAE